MTVTNPSYSEFAEFRVQADGPLLLPVLLRPIEPDEQNVTSPQLLLCVMVVRELVVTLGHITVILVFFLPICLLLPVEPLVKQGLTADDARKGASEKNGFHCLVGDQVFPGRDPTKF